MGNRECSMENLEINTFYFSFKLSIIKLSVGFSEFLGVLHFLPSKSQSIVLIPDLFFSLTSIPHVVIV